MAVGCYNVAATMFRLCIDLSTRKLIASGEHKGLTKAVKRNLGLRLPWLIENSYLPAALQELSTCIKDDGNDGAYDGSIGKEDAEDILDFSYELLERLYTEPKKLELAKERRIAHRAKK